MKEFSMLIWLTQLGLSVAAPLAGFILLGIRLHRALGWGIWTVFAGLGLGLVCGFRSFRDALKAMERASRDPRRPNPSAASFNIHD